MIVDLDGWLADEQERAAEGRVFPHDMFISHRRFDLPTGLVDSLSARGANVVWDCDLDLRDRRVMQGVANAMRRSRFVALYVSDRYVDSPWCRAEYLNAVWVEEKFSIPRAVVICESEAALSRVPECLHTVRRFVLADEGERELTGFVVSGNSVNGNATAAALRHRVPSERLVQDVDLLSFDEQLNLLEQRTHFWSERGTAEINASEKEQAAVRLTELMSDPITEVEKIFRDVCNIVFESRASDCRRSGIGAQELTRVVTMARAVADGYSRPARAAELEGIEKWVYDFVLKPLLLAVELEETRSEAAVTYRALCSGLRLSRFSRPQAADGVLTGLKGAMVTSQIRDAFLVFREQCIWLRTCYNTCSTLPGNLVRDQASRVLLLHSLRAADALQLAAALVWAGSQIPSLEFVCLDHRLREAAAREGFQIIP